MGDLNYNNMGKAPFIKLQGNQNADPDAKIKMSLDDIIQIYGPAAGRRFALRRKQQGANLTRNFKRASVRVGSTGGGHFFVTKNSPLLRRARNREIELKARAEINRALNAPILHEKEEIIPATYKLIKTSRGVQRILVPATMNNPMPLLKVPIPRRPVQKLGKSKPPPLIDTAMSTTGSVMSFKTTQSFKSTQSLKSSQSFKSIRTSLSSRLGPPPLVDMSVRLGPPPLIVKKANYSQPPPLVDSKFRYSQPPPLVDSQLKFSQPPPLVDSRFKFSQPPPLIDARRNGMPPPLIDLADSDDVDMDIKPPSLISGSRQSMSLNERFSNFYN